MSGRILFLSAVMMAGCVVEDVVDEENLGEVEQGIAMGCPAWECGTNSPILNGHGFHDLDERGYVTQDGFRLLGFEQYGKPYRLDVQRGRLLGREITTDGTLGTIRVSSDLLNLKGATMKIENTNTKEVFTVMVAEVNTENVYWATPTGWTTPPRFESYKLVWDDPQSPGEWPNVCANGATTAEGIPAEHTVLVEGDRINGIYKTVTSADGNLFNLGCAGHAIAKMHLTGHTNAAWQQIGSAFYTSLSERQAILKMFSADYCGTGYAYTVAGTKLQWADHKDWMNFSGSLVTIESRWTSSGATCVSSARLGQAAKDQMAANNCVRPACSPTTLTEFAGTHLISAKPITLVLF